ncbi:MAG: hypothetical protein AAGJ94_00820 [Pseudomonadota bacterium]
MRRILRKILLNELADYDVLKNRLYSSKPIDPRHEGTELQRDGKLPPLADERDVLFLERFGRVHEFANHFLSDTSWRLQKKSETVVFNLGAVDSPSYGLNFSVYFNERVVGALEMTSDGLEASDKIERAIFYLKVSQPRLLNIGDLHELCGITTALFTDRDAVSDYSSLTSERDFFRSSFDHALLSCLWEPFGAWDTDSLEVKFNGTPSWYFRWVGTN